MTIMQPNLPRIMHAVAGRVRMRLTGQGVEGQKAVAAGLRWSPGVREVQANALTGNLLVLFDPAATDEQAILMRVCALARAPLHAESHASTSLAILRPTQERPTGCRDNGHSVRMASARPPASLSSPASLARALPAAIPIGDLLIKGASFLLGLLLADSPLGLVLSGLELCGLLACLATRPR